MATKPVHGHHHHHAHRAQHHAQHQQGDAHQPQKAHRSGEKPTLPAQANPPAPALPPQAAASAPPPALATPAVAPAAPQQLPAKKDEYAAPAQVPVNLQPGATGERKPPVIATPAGGGAPAVDAQAAAQKPAITLPSVSQSNNLQWISQLDPKASDDSYTNGAMNCGPAAGAMIARDCGYGEKMTDAQLVENLADVAQTDATGTSGNGMIAMYQEMGLETASTGGADMSWINAQLSAGHYITALGDYWQVPGRIDPLQTAGHYMDVTGYKEATPGKDATYRVSDPADQNLNFMSYAELQSFISAAPNGGFAIATWNEATTAADTAIV